MMVVLFWAFEEKVQLCKAVNCRFLSLDDLGLGSVILMISFPNQSNDSCLNSVKVFCICFVLFL